MKLPKMILGIDKADKDFTVFIVMELIPNKINTSINVTIKEALIRDYYNKNSHLTKEEADLFFEEQKKLLMEKYRIQNKNVII